MERDSHSGGRRPLVRVIDSSIQILLDVIEREISQRLGCHATTATATPQRNRTAAERRRVQRLLSRCARLLAGHAA